MTATITLDIPEEIHQRLINTAQATQRPLKEIICVHLRSSAVQTRPYINN